MEQNKIKVSICCVTFNQVKYISNALESFLMQKCDFNYEIIVHDDCSNDGTIDVLKRYEKKYPSTIKVIYEEYNQYSQGKKILPFTFEEARGDYIAICEGDDYWIDEKKLQKQIDYLDVHPNCSLTFHNAYILNQNTGDKAEFMSSNLVSKKYLKMDNCFAADELELLGSIPTASMVTRTEFLKQLPQWYYDCSVGDLPIELHTASKGYAYYFSDIMSVYRVQTGQSVVDSWNHYNKEKRVQLEMSVISMIKSFDKETQYKYHDNLQKSIDKRSMNLYYFQNDFVSLRDKCYRVLIKQLGIRERIKYYTLIYFPHLVIFLKKMKSKV